ncbi:hypothetical protein [Methylobacterium nonmethylotrophicum]|uniref:Uncharacterized protein n=1 Tax=Methylobacterium nonmethylotrophicum TaxID=1141884 RepID=A0A4Z0NTT7_9HYPH|nr:hypothetical protein [Methylobacterium nonmethylotrophicum]TGE00615.1 hypothetical protein EU555_07645 [Methylobacterium nonmethylotrophicum]
MTTLAQPADRLAPVRPIARGLPVPGAGILRLGPAGRTIAVVYGTCLLLALAYPQALVAWLDDFEPNPAVDAAQACASRLVALSESLGLAPISGALRERGKDLTRKPD